MDFTLGTFWALGAGLGAHPLWAELGSGYVRKGPSCPVVKLNLVISPLLAYQVPPMPSSLFSVPCRLLMTRSRDWNSACNCIHLEIPVVLIQFSSNPFVLGQVVCPCGLNPLSTGTVAIFHLALALPRVV